jgi:predicted DNA-binding transcriptional regulator AlpA
VTTLNTLPQPAAAAAPPSPQLLDAKQVGVRLGCSWRHVLRMADRGLMPWGAKLGALRRWSADELEDWIKSGCRPVRQAGAKAQ